MGIKSAIKSILGKNPPTSVPKKLTMKDIASQSLAGVPRYTSGMFTFLEKQLAYTDSASTIFIIQELFDKEIYKFNTSEQSPYIIDCGANIGLSIIYFKKLFAEAKIIGFEPDAKVCEVLKLNMQSYGLNNVEILPYALWNEETELEFNSEGADAGRVAVSGDANIVRVKTTKLSSWLNRKVDFLKIDIEGAELTVLQECKDQLKNVERIFVEFHSFVGKQQHLSELLAILESAGFRLNINSPGLVSDQPFVHIKKYNGMDLQLNIYGYRS